MSEYRTEEDTLGPVKIPAEALWGPQTERSRNNFPTGQYMPLAIIRQDPGSGRKLCDHRNQSGELF